MALSVRPKHLRRYKDVVRLLVKYGRRDIVAQAGLDEVLEGERADSDLSDKGESLAQDLEALGPTYVKLGQLLSTRADLLPAPYIKALARLQDDVEPFSAEEAEEVFCAAVGARPKDVFGTFDYTPIASASLGQVHRATLRDGRPVAVKIQRPGIRQQVVEDMDALEELAELIDHRTEWGERFGLAAMVDQFRRSLMRELDYRREAQNLLTLRENLASFDRIVVPEPIVDLSRATVLTMEFVDGRKINSLGPLAMTDVDGPVLADQLFGAYLKQVLQDGFFHADPHPGNVYLTDGGDLALLDLGMVARVDEGMQDSLVKLLLAVSEGRGPDAAEAAMGLGEMLESFERDRFCREVADLVSSHQGQVMRDIQPGAIVAELTRIAGDAGLRPAPELTMLGKALLNLDDVARRLDPEFDPNAAIQRDAAGLLESRFAHAISPSHLFTAALDAKEFAEKLPGRLNHLLDTIAGGEITFAVKGIDEKEILRSVHRLANRVVTGLLLASLIVGAALLMRVDTPWKLLGYPGLAIVCFMLAAAIALGLVVSIFIGDRRRDPR
ncbi:MAG: AarF/ABC1/UbiB kinase family protein [Acidimicrobiia bacterium]|nr:AarF/ABC1/UbiB kinase family protein [Acidimicrobiia bacterium]